MAYDPNQKRVEKGKAEGGQWTKAGNAARKAAGLPARLGGGLAGLVKPTPTDIARSEMELPKEIQDRAKKDEEEDGVWWRILDSKMEQVEPPEGVNVPYTEEQRNGNCYMYAARLVMENPDWQLVHANLFPLLGPFQDMAYNHAFAMKGNLIYDGVLNKFFTKASYWKAFFPVDLRIYSYDTAMKMMLKKKTYGDWE